MKQAQDLLGQSSFAQSVFVIQGSGLFLLTVFSFFPVLFHVEEILFFILLGLALIIGLFQGHELKIRTPIDLPLALLLAWVLLTVPFSLNPEYSFVEWRKLLTQCLVFYWAVYVVRHLSQLWQGSKTSRFFEWLGVSGEQAYTKIVFLGVLVSTLFLAALALMDFVSRGGDWHDRDIRAIVPGSDYNWLSTYLVLSIPIVFYCGLTSRALRGKIFSYGTLALALLAHLASYTRAGWLASVAQLFAWGIVTRRRILFVGLLLVIFLGSVAMLGVAKMGLQADTLHAWTLEARIQVWKLGMDQILSHPIVGIGYGNNIFQPVLVDSPMGDKPMHLHNTFLMFGVGSGIPGLVLFLWVFFRLGVQLFQKVAGKDWTEIEPLSICFGVVLVGFLCRNFFDYMFAGSLAYLFWILMACGLETASKRVLAPEREPSFQT